MKVNINSGGNYEIIIACRFMYIMRTGRCVNYCITELIRNLTITVTNSQLVRHRTPVSAVTIFGFGITVPV